MTPHQLVGIEVWGIAWEEVQRQPPFARGYVFTHDRSLVGGQAVQNQMDRFPAPIHHFLEQLDEQFAVERTFIDTEPERPLRRHRRSRTHRLALSRTLHHRGMAAYAPSLAMNSVCTKPRLVPEKYFRALGFRLSGNRRIGFSLPLLDCLRVPLVGTLQWLLRGQSKPCQQLTYRSNAEVNTKALLDQLTAHGAGPQPEVQAIL